MLGRDPVEFYAPRCAGHYASIFTTDAEAPLDSDPHQGMNKIYQFTQHGILPNTSAITMVNTATQLSPPSLFKLSGDPTRAWFRIQLPRPKRAVAIKADPVGVKGTNAPTGSSYATAMRLIYDYDMDRPTLQLGGGSAFNPTLQDYSAASPNAPSKFDVTVRLVGPFLFDFEHNDACECFKATARLFQLGNTDLDWELIYPQTRLLGRPGGDCGSPHLVSL
jgi:hypothetical protein